MKQQYIITVELPSGVSILDMADYIRSSVRSMVGGMDPEMAITNLKWNSVRVKPIKKDIKQ